MEKTERLFQIIKKMTKTEKRFFKLYSNLYETKNKKQYLLLFDIMDQMEVYDSHKLNRATQAIFNSKHLPSIKTYLKKNIFESLRLYHRNTYDKVNFYDALSTAIVLGKKDLNDESLRILEQQKLVAQKKMTFIEEMVINKLINSLKTHSSKFKEFNQMTLDYISLQEKCIEDFKVWLQISILNSKVKILERSLEVPPYEKKEIFTQIINELLDKGKERALVPRIAFLHLTTLVQAYYNANDEANCIATLEELYQLTETNSNIFLPNLRVAVYLRLGSYYALSNPERFWHMVEQVNQILPLLSGQALDLAKLRRLHLIMNFYINHINETMPKQLIEEIDLLLGLKELHTHRSNRNLLCILVGQYYFLRRNYHQSKNYIDKVLLVHNIKPQSQGYVNLKIMNIICYLELNKLDLAIKALKSLKRKLHREQHINEPFKAFLTLITKLLNTLSKNRPANELYYEMQEIIHQNSQDPIFRVELNVIQIWIEHQLSLIDLPPPNKSN